MLKAIELLVIEHEDVRVVLKGDYDPSKNSSTASTVQMGFSCSAPEARVSIFDGHHLVPFEQQALTPIFFENGRYELLLLPHQGAKLGFFHEYHSFREAISEVAGTGILTGILHFQNEVGLSELGICNDGETLFTFKIEIFPTKLDYQQDYKALLNEVNDEIYNLAYSFIKKTYLNAARRRYQDPSLIEFYRVLETHIQDFMESIAHVERAPHHQLETVYEEVRGERLRRQDSRGLKYLRKNAQLFVDVEQGLPIGGRQVMPQKGLLIKKKHNFDTHENRYVKWGMTRIQSRLLQLRGNYLEAVKKGNTQMNQAFVDKLEQWIAFFHKTVQKSFWREIGRLDRSIYSLVMQMAPGYKEVFQIYTYVSQSLTLQNDIYKMSVKDIATLYEYWTFLKLGKILAEKTVAIDHNVVKVDTNGLYNYLLSGQSVRRTFEHPLTKEKIELTYQYKAHATPTVNQEPDTMLTIEKRGSSGEFRYIFDAKYAIDIDERLGIGPKNRDINVMHRYRDAIVAKSGAHYKRETFGAYVLFPGQNNTQYQQHPLYKSIDEVNIGGLPFLPNDTELVEQIVDNLLHKSAQELQAEGILPQGTLEYLIAREGTVLIIHERHIENTAVNWEDFDSVSQLMVSRDILPLGAIQVGEIAIATHEGIRAIADVRAVEVTELLTFHIGNQQDYTLKAQFDYNWQGAVIVAAQMFDEVNCLEELFAPREVVQVFSRLNAKVNWRLESADIVEGRVVDRVWVDGHIFRIFDNQLHYNDQYIHLGQPMHNVFKWVQGCLNDI